MIEVGFGTGSLYKQKIPLEKILDFYKNIGATAVEISFGSVNELMEFKLNKNITNKINSFNFVSIHAPFRDIKYNLDNKTEKVLEKLDYLNKNIPTKGIVIHPDIIENPYVILGSKLPFLIENMNLEKKSGRLDWEFENYNQFNLRYVLDIEHSYGIDPTKELTNKLIEIMGSKLNHLHVSGKRDSKNHHLCHLSENKSFIEKILTTCNVPRISEGILPSLDYDIAKKEIDYLKGLS